jgi:hypothetical protein
MLWLYAAGSCCLPPCCWPVRYVAGEDVLGLCAEVDFPPCLMMRRMLELLMRLSKQVRCQQHSWQNMRFSAA